MWIYSQTREGGWIFKCSEQVVVNYEYASQDYFCSMIDKFPVWNLKSYLAMMMRHMVCSEGD